MATPTQVKNYLAYWFQLGKQVVTHDGRQHYRPETVIQGDRFSPEFEKCWRAILESAGSDCYLEGTDQTIDELLSPSWDVISCARCNMPVPTPEVTIQQHLCPCHDLDSWPNEELPKPRLPINSQKRLADMRSRLSANLHKD